VRAPAGTVPALAGSVRDAAVAVAQAEVLLLGVPEQTRRAGHHTSVVRTLLAVAAVNDGGSEARLCRLELLRLAGLLGAADTTLQAVEAELAGGFIAHMRAQRGPGVGAVAHAALLLGEGALTVGAEQVVGLLPPEVTAGVLVACRLGDDGPGYAAVLSTSRPGGDVGAVALDGWLRRVEELPAGAVAVTDLGNGHWVVQLPGIHSLLPGPDPQDLTGAVVAMGRGHSAYSRSVVLALQLAGVPPGARLMLVGHSQGGIVAADLARDRSVTARWRVTHVVTAGSPVSRIPVPAGTRELEVDNAHDLVPELDGVRSHDGDGGDRTVLRFRAEHGSVGPDHSVTTAYQPALSAGAVTDPRVREWAAGAGPFLQGGPATTTIVRIADRPPP